MTNHLFTVPFLLFVFFQAFAQSTPYFDLITLEEGISNGFVTSIYQDEKGMMWFGTADGLNCYDGYSFRSFFWEDGNPNGLSHPTIWALTGDQQRNLWIGTEGGLNKLNLATEAFSSFLHDPKDPTSLSHNSVESIAIDTAGKVWIGTANGLNLWEGDSPGFSRYFFHPLPAIPRMVKSVFCDQNGTLWIGSLDTIYQHLGEGHFTPFPIPESLNLNREFCHIRTIYEDSKNRLWIGTENAGLYVFDKSKKLYIAHYQYFKGNKNSLSHNKVTAVLEDEDELIWVGTYGGGLNIINEKTKTVQQFNYSIPNSLSVSTIRSLLKDEAGNIWLGSSYEGLYLVKKHRKPFRNYTKKEFPSIGMVSAFHEDQNRGIWIGSTKGLNYFNAEDNTLVPIRLPERLQNENINAITEDQSGTLWMILGLYGLASYHPTNQSYTYSIPVQDGCTGWLYAVMADREDNIWIGSDEGICRYQTTSQSFLHYPLVENKEGFGNNRRVTSIHESRNGDIWVATYGGLNYYDQQKDSFKYYPSRHFVYTICESLNGGIWAGTRAGLAKFDPKTGQFQYLNHIKGATRSKAAIAVLEDADHRLWFSSNENLFCFDPTKEEIIGYNQEDGLVSNQFFEGSLHTRSGDMYFCGPKGFIRFTPEEIRQNTFIPPVVLTRFQLFNRDVPIANSPTDTLKWTSPLSNGITYSSKIKLKHWQNDFSFEFTALDFTASEKNSYQYKLEGYDENWKKTISQKRFAYYTNLSPGSYTFKVRGSNSDQIWNEEGAAVEISITPPWYWNAWSKSTYMFLFLVVVYRLYRFQLSRQLARAEAIRLQELDAAKTRLYTNITHEFRTPLTIILGLTDQMKNQVSKHLKTNLKIVMRNGQQLLKLINQMLDISKLESGHLKLEMQQGDIINYLQYLTDSFHSYAASKQVRLHFLSELPEFFMDYDPTRLMHVVSNLFSNAIKFSLEGQDVYISVDVIDNSPNTPDVLRIRFKDSGIGIPEYKIPFIFDRFYQADDSLTRKGEGTGIGLTLVNELVKLMHGQIRVKSELGKGSEFIVTLPVTRMQEIKSKLPEVNVIPEIQIPTQSGLTKKSESPLMLIVEDNPDLVKYLVTSFNPAYNLEVAYNGHQGIKKAISLIPDIIITDVMMPEKDGFELCITLKNNNLTSHIPIIMLTAKVDLKARLTGFRRGADAYLAKPFLKEELEVRVKALLKQRQKLQAYYRSQAGISESTQLLNPATEAVKLENAFLANVNRIIETNISNHEFTVEQLCQEMFIDPSNLFRKLKALTGISPNQYIRSFRLAKAKKLLVNTDLPIVSVAAECGFTYQHYFSRIFKREFDVTPTTYRSENSQ